MIKYIIKNLRVVDFILTLLSIITLKTIFDLSYRTTMYTYSLFLQSSKEIIDFKTRSIVNDQRGGEAERIVKKKKESKQGLSRKGIESRIDI